MEIPMTTQRKKSPLAWVGGKSQLTDQIIPLMPAHTCYCEVFAGAAWLLFRKEESKVEIINDINLELITLYRVVKNHLEEFIRTLKWLLVARDEFDRFMLQEPTTLTDIQRSVRFFYIMKTGYGARLKNPSFGIGASAPSRFNLLRIEEELSAAHLRLARVYVENRPYQTVIDRFDKPDTLFYVDPPYFGCENYYGNGIFSRDDFEVLRDRLAKIKGKFIMSINDVPAIREQFKEFHIRSVATRYSLGAKSNKAISELIITNYKPPKV
jgi:DNA adenine methylase